MSPPVRADPVSSGECGVDCGETEKGVPCRSRTHTRTTRSLSLSTDYTLHTLHTSTVYKVVTVFMHTHDTATADSITVFYTASTPTVTHTRDATRTRTFSTNHL